MRGGLDGWLAVGRVRGRRVSVVRCVARRERNSGWGRGEGQGEGREREYRWRRGAALLASTVRWGEALAEKVTWWCRRGEGGRSRRGWG